MQLLQTTSLDCGTTEHGSVSHVNNNYVKSVETMRTVIRFRLLLILPLLLYCFTACTASRPEKIPGYPNPYKVFNRWYQPIPSAKGFSQTGTASWYGKKFHGRKTANGEIYNMYALTAAHKTLPLGTWLYVENTENGKTVKVRVNDRGPFVGERIIDLSYKAALAIDMTGNGTATVKIRAIGKPVAKTGKKKKNVIENGLFSAQAGSFSDKANAERFMAELSEVYNDVYVRANAGVYKVRVGRYSSREKAVTMKETLKKDGFKAFIVQDE